MNIWKYFSYIQGAPPLKLEKNLIFFLVKSWFFTRNTPKSAPPNLKSWIRPWYHHDGGNYLWRWNETVENQSIKIGKWQDNKYNIRYISCFKGILKEIIQYSTCFVFKQNYAIKNEESFSWNRCTWVN